MMQNQYCHMMDQTAPGEDLIQAALQQSTAARRCRRRKRPRLAAAVAAAVLAAVIMAMPVMAAVEPFREVLYAFLLPRRSILRRCSAPVSAMESAWRWLPVLFMTIRRSCM